MTVTAFVPNDFDSRNEVSILTGPKFVCVRRRACGVDVDCFFYCNAKEHCLGLALVRFDAANAEPLHRSFHQMTLHCSQRQRQVSLSQANRTHRLLGTHRVLRARRFVCSLTCSCTREVMCP